MTAALLGTRRRAAPPLPEAPPPAGAAADAGDDPAARLLDQAALLTARRRAGRLPETAEPVAPAPAETARIVPPAAARRLRQILAGEQARVLPEWLAAAADAGRRVPPALLPDLLDKGRADRALRPHIARAAGRRGVWLAMRNVDWAYLVVAGDGAEAADPQVWETGIRPQRLAHLRRLRATDPAAALATLRRTWTREPAPERALFLAVFEPELSPADEEFLEAALDDRGVEVRRIAADLLARLPGSAYARRMAERGRSCLRLDPDRRWIVADPPDGHDEAMRRDGIPFHATEPIGNRAGWLREILARAPLATWTRLFGMAPGDIVALPVADAAEARGSTGTGRHADRPPDDPHPAEDVHLGWARAAVRQRDAAWARALLAPGAAVGDADVVTGLLDVLPAGERDRAAAGVVRRITDRTALLTFLDRLPGPWHGELADAVIQTLSALSLDAAGDRRGAGPAAAGAPRAGRAAPGRIEPAGEYVLAELCRPAGERLAPETASLVAELARRRPGAWPLAELAETLRFRAEMVRELR